MRHWLAAIFVWLTCPAAAQEFIQTDALLSDDAFYRLVACAAPPGADCSKPMIYWPQDKRSALRVGFVTKTPALAPWQERIYTRAFMEAVAEINKVCGGIQLKVAAPTDTIPPDIALHVLDTRPGEEMVNTGVPVLEGRVLSLGQVMVRARNSWIDQAVISMSVDTPRRAIASVVLEEVVQALGLMTDIRSPVYRRSVFSEDSNSGTRLRGQDAMAIRRHYPPT